MVGRAATSLFNNVGVWTSEFGSQAEEPREAASRGSFLYCQLDESGGGESDAPRGRHRGDVGWVDGGQRARLAAGLGVEALEVRDPHRRQAVGTDAVDEH